MKLRITSIVSQTQAEYRETVEAILKGIRIFKKRHSYKEYLPQFMPYDDAKRQHVAIALMEIYKYCSKENLPFFNFLLVTRKENFQGSGFYAYWKGQYGSLDGVDAYCDLQAKTAEGMLGSGLIELV